MASAILTSLLYGFVFTNFLAEELAIPWTSFRQQIVMVDWTCLFFASFATALLIGLNTSRFTVTKGLISGGIIGAALLLLGSVVSTSYFGSGYYLICYLLWGWIFGLIAHKRQQFVIRQF